MKRKRHNKGIAWLAAAIAALFALAFLQYLVENWNYTPKNFDEAIARAAVKYGVEENLIRAVIWRESRFRPDIRGKSGEYGLMQIMPSVAEDWSKSQKRKMPEARELFMPDVNIEIGTWCLARAAGHWKGYKSRAVLQLAEYNAGYRTVKSKWTPGTPGDEVKIEDISYPGTRAYIAAILKKKAAYDRECKERM